MKKIQVLFSLIVLICSLNSHCQVCSPVLDDIYGFDIGSTFQYKKTSTSSFGGNPLTYTEIEKYTVTDKWKENDMIGYIRDGIRLTYSSHEINYEPIVYTASEYVDTVYIIDSTAHLLNACDSQLVFIGLENDFYTYIIIDGNKKKIGGFENLHQYNDNDSLEVVSDYEFEQIYGTGIGLQSESEWIFEHTENILLEGYIIDGDTTGVIWKDSDFITSNDLITLQPIAIYPTIIRDNEMITISNTYNIDYIRITTMTGHQQRFDLVNNSEIRLINTDSGIYLITVMIKNKVFTRKIIKM